MLEYRLGPADLARIRFGRSPMLELACSVRVLARPAQHAMHQPWLATARPRLAGLTLDLLPVLCGQPRLLPDFLVPLAAGVEPALAEIRQTSADAVRANLAEVWGDQLPAALRPLADDPARALGRLADELAGYWAAAIAPVWPRLVALYEADLAYRATELTSDGVGRVLADLHPEIEYADNWLRLRRAGANHRQVLTGTGVLLVPCVFGWPTPLGSTKPDCQPVITYVPRGIGQVWLTNQDGSTSRDTALGELLGRSRAALLAHLDLPLSTTQLAAHLGMTAGTVSEHLSVLHRAQLVTRRRAGRTVLYQRTPLATRLLAAQSVNPSS